MIVTLLTDFGTADYYVGAMKGVILSVDPEIRVVDLTHAIPRHDIEEAAFQLAAVYADFPSGTTHIVVVDPGVGSDRRAIAARCGGRFFVGPDNGVLSYVFDGESEVEVRSIDHPRCHRPGGGSTFHGRDIFAPTGAALAAGFPFETVGAAVENPVRLAPMTNRQAPNGTVIGRVIHIDHFGNCVTSFRRDALQEGPESYRFRMGDLVIDEARSFYGEGVPGEPFVIWGSAGFLEISVDRESAARRLGLHRGTEVRAERR